VTAPRGPAATSPPLRGANVSGFYGDRLSAMREMLDGGAVDVVTGDYPAELTMLILGGQRQNDDSRRLRAQVSREVLRPAGTALPAAWPARGRRLRRHPLRSAGQGRG
jgi:hypothetical protein